MIVILILTVACHGPVKDDTVLASPRACEDLILVPVAGTVSADPVPADAHAPDLGSAPSPRLLHRGLFRDPAEDATFVWQTDPGTLASTVRIRPENGGAFTVL